MVFAVVWSFRTKIAVFIDVYMSLVTFILYFHIKSIVPCFSFFFLSPRKSNVTMQGKGKSGFYAGELLICVVDEESANHRLAALESSGDVS